MGSYSGQISQSSDDAEERNGAMNLTNQSMSLFSPNYDGGWRFTGVNIPANATITTAYMQFYLPDDSDDFFDDKTVYGENGSNPPTFTTDANNIGDRTTTLTSIPLGSGGQGTGWVNTPELKTIVQEIVDDNAGTGDAIIFLCFHTGTTDLEIRAWDYGAAHELGAKLEMTWTEAVVAGAGSPIHLIAKVLGVVSITKLFPKFSIKGVG